MAEKIIEASKVPEEKVKVLRQEIATIDTRNANLYAAIESGLGLTDVIPRINENNERKQLLEQQLQQLNRPAAVMNRDVLTAILRADADHLHDEPAAQKEIIKRYIQCITIFETSIRLTVTATFLKYVNKKVATSSALGVCNHDA